MNAKLALGSASTFVLVLAAIVALAFGVSSGPAYAAELLQSHPAAGASLPGAPQEIRLWFDVEPMTPTTQLQIAGPGGAVIPVRSVHTMGDRDLMGFVTDELSPGSYRLQWQVGADSGAIPFSIQPRE